MGAALAYYTAFSLAPVLILVIAVAGLAFGADAARGEIVAQLRGLLGEQGAKAIEELLASASKPGSGAVASAWMRAPSGSRSRAFLRRTAAT